jgi:flagellar basal body rod protein FlgG
MATMVSTERSYQLTSTAIQNESQMMSIANQLRPS